MKERNRGIEIRREGERERGGRKREKEREKEGGMERERGRDGRLSTPDKVLISTKFY